MTKEKTNPNDSATGFAWSQEQQGTSGLTKREYFAAMAMQGLLARSEFSWEQEIQFGHCVQCAKLAVQAADSLIAELNK
jgi:hypothetical protein